MQVRDEQDTGSKTTAALEPAAPSAGQQLADIVKSLFLAYRRREAPAREAPSEGRPG